VARRRNADALVIALRQIAAMAVDDSDYDPAAAATRQIERRRATAATVIRRAGPIQRRILQQLNQVTTAIADGQLIEVDGSAGSVRLLSASD